MKYYFIVNPSAGNGQGENKIKEEISNLKETIDYEIYVTKSGNDIGEYCKKVIASNKNNKIALIPVGGDGSINLAFEEAINCENVYCSCIPNGSGNDLVKAFGKDVFTVKNIINGFNKKIDAMKVNDRYCFNVCNFGIDTAVVNNVNQKRIKRGHGSPIDYITGIFKALFTSFKTKCAVYVNGELINKSGYIISTSLSNGQYVGGGFYCGPNSLIDDGLIDACIIDPIPAIKFPSFILAYKNGKHLNNPKMEKYVHYMQTKEIKLIADDNFFYSLDGEVIKAEEVNISMVPKAINFIVPKGGVNEVHN